MTRRWLSRVAALMPAIGILFLLTACSSYHDAWVVNPCPAIVRIETYSDPPERFNHYPPERSVAIAAGSKSLVKDAFTDAGGYDWSIRIVDYGVIAVDGQSWEDNTVNLPAEACGAAP